MIIKKENNQLVEPELIFKHEALNIEENFKHGRFQTNEKLQFKVDIEQLQAEILIKDELKEQFSENQRKSYLCNFCNKTF